MEEASRAGAVGRKVRKRNRCLWVISEKSHREKKWDDEE